MTVEWQSVHLPLAVGVQTKVDSRAMQPPGLAVCKNGEFDEVGGIQTRPPLGELLSSDLNSVANIRRLAVYEGELLAFTKEALYSYSEADGRWILKSSYLAAKLTERTVFATTTDATRADRCEIGDSIVFTWMETGSKSYVAMMDRVTGAVTAAPYYLGANSERPKVVALASTVLLFWHDAGAGDLMVRELDPTDRSATFGAGTGDATVVGGALVANGPYDVAMAGSTVACVVCTLAPATSYRVATVGTGPLVLNAVTKARTADLGVAIAVSNPTGRLAVIRGIAGAVEGDIIDAATLADVAAAVAMGATTATSIAAAFKTTTDAGVYRCYCFWGLNAGTTGDRVDTNYITSAGVAGAPGLMKRHLGVASRAFVHNGRIYVWLSFNQASTGAQRQLQNTYFLYRDDGFMVAKAAGGRAGGHPGIDLPNVQSLGGNRYGWCGIESRIVPSGSPGFRNYASRAPREIVVEFDSNEARRTVQLGRTLYIVGGEILQYDGNSLVEVGFHLYPWAMTLAELVSAGAVANGSYAVKYTWRDDNARGERDRSTTATIGTIAIAAGPNSIEMSNWPPLPVTKRANVVAEVWRTKVNAGVEAPMFLVTNNDPTDLAGANCHVPNVTTSQYLTTFEDALDDATIAQREASSENGDVLESISPPAATIVTASQDRLFLAGLADNPYRILYSKYRADGELAAFHDALAVDLPPAGGPITALAFLNETLIAFEETAIYALPGDGLDNLGGGANYGPARLLSNDVGAVSAETVALTPRGLIFKSQKGWYLLDRSWSVNYIGAPVKLWDDDTVVAVHVLPKRHQIRCLGQSSRLLMLDYGGVSEQGEWSEWEIDEGLHAVVRDGDYLVLNDDGVTVHIEQPFSANPTGADYGLDVESAWINPAGPQGYLRTRWIMILGEFRSAHRLRIRIAKNYQESDLAGPTWVIDRYWRPEPTVIGGPLQVRVGLGKYQKCESLKVRVTAVHETASGPPPGEAVRLTGLSLSVGIKRGLNRGLPRAQKAVG